jgi:hypothetical protein
VVPYAVKDRAPAIAASIALALWTAYVFYRYAPNHPETLPILPFGEGVVSSLACGVLLFVAAASLGEAVLAWLHPVNELDLRLLTAVGVGTGLIGTLVFMLGAVRGVAFAPVVTILVLSTIVGIRRLVRDVGEAFRGLRNVPPPAYAAALVAMLFLIAALAPPNDWDELGYHIPIAVRAVQTRHFPIFAHDQSYLPSLCESLTTAGLLMGGSYGVGRVLHLFFGWSLAGAVYVGSASLQPKNAWPRWLSVAIIMLEPVFIDESRVADIDLALAFYAILALIHVIRGETWRDVLLAGVLGGFACGTTYRAIHVAVALAAAALVMRRFRTFLALALGGFVAAVPWYFRNAVVTGDPVYPFLSGVFPTRTLPTGFTALGWPHPELLSRDFNFSSVVGRAMGPLPFLDDPIAYLKVPWDATIEGRIHTQARFAADISPLYLSVAPACVFARPDKVPRQVAAWVVFALVHSFTWSLSVPGTRYELPAFAALAVALPALFAALRWDLLRRTAFAASAAVCGVLYASTVVKELHRADTRYVFGGETRDHYLVRHEDGQLFALIDHINASPPSVGPILMIGEKRGLYLERPFIPDFNLDNIGALYRNGGKTAEGMHALLAESGIKYILEHSIRAGSALTPEESLAYGELIANYTTRYAPPGPQHPYLALRVVQ